MESKLLRDPETDVAANRHERRARRMRNIPIQSNPNVHAGTNSRVRRDSCKQHISAASVLCGSPDLVVLRMQPGERRADEPFAGYVLRFVRSIGEPESRFNRAAQPSLLRSPGTNHRMKILVRDQSPKIEEAGVGPVRRDQEIRRAGARLHGGGQELARVVRQIRSTGRYLWPTGYRRLRRSALRIAPIKAIFHEQQRVAQSGSIRQQSSAGNLEMVGEDWNNHGQIKIGMKAPSEIEIAFMRKRWPRRRRNRFRWIGHKAPRGKNRVVRDKRPARKKRRSGFRRRALRAGRRSGQQQEHRQ